MNVEVVRPLSEFDLINQIEGGCPDAGAWQLLSEL